MENIIKYIVKLMIVMLIVLPLYLLFRRPWKRKGEGKREIVLAVFVLYMTGLLALVLEGDYGTPAAMLQSAAGRIKSGQQIYLIPFQTIVKYLRDFELEDFLINIVGNVIMFMPWGFGLVLLWKKNHPVKRILLFSFLLTAFIETSQLFIGRNTDIDDIILNFLGGVAGAGLYFAVKKIAPAIGEMEK